MIVRALLVILLIFILLVVIVPLILNALGVPIFGGGGGGTSVGDGKRGVLYRSLDAGKTWDAPEFSREPRAALPTEILDIAFDLTDEKVVFAGTKGAGLWKSDDAGLTWKRLSDEKNILHARADVYKIAISRTRPDVMYLAIFQASRGRVLQSKDRGRSFREIYSVTGDRFGVFDLYTPPHAPDTIMIVTGEGRILESADAGSRWRIVKNFSDPVMRLIVNPVYSGERYALTGLGAMAKTFDGGAAWTDLGDVSQNVGVQTGVIRHPYANWRGTFDVHAPGLSLAINPHNPALLWAARNADLFSSANGGFSWQSVTSLIAGQNTALGGVAVSAKGIFVTAGPDVYQSADGGTSWSRTRVAERGNMTAVFIHPRRPEIMFIAAGR